MNVNLKAMALVLCGGLALQTGVVALFSTATDLPAEGAPIAQEIEVLTYRDIPYQGQFLATDSQGDDITYQVVDAPKKGSVTVEGTLFVYTPNAGKTGSDRFTYQAVDSHGNGSLPATVTVTIDKEKSGVTYSDTSPMEGAAAQHLAEAGVFVGSRIGNSYQFEPERTMTRSEFLAMAMEVVDAPLTDVTVTGFCDDETVPTWAKGYVAAGLMEGFVQGKSTDQGMAFAGDSPIRYDEAAAILSRALSLRDVDLTLWYGEEEVVATFGAQAVGNLESVAVLAPGSVIDTDLSEPLTRGQGAQMLSATLHLVEEQEPGILDWLF